jgi:precorrin-2 dehydrogenase/sirohydrochlorin ferrochelatase
MASAVRTGLQAAHRWQDSVGSGRARPVEFTPSDDSNKKSAAMPRTLYPIFLDLSGRRCAVIGGGSVAERKAGSLLTCGARVKVVSPKLTRTLRKWAEGERIDYVPRRYRKGDLKGVSIVVAASDDGEVNRKVWEEASALGIPANVVDYPDYCSFFIPSVVRRGQLTLAISTSGASPALAKKLRKDFEGKIGSEYADLLRVLERLRAEVLAKVKDPARRRRILQSVAGDQRLLERLRHGETPGALLKDLRRDLKLGRREGHKADGDNK